MTLTGLSFGGTMSTHLFCGGYVYMPDTHTFRRADILIGGGRIISVGDCADTVHDTETDCTGRYIIPGLVDVHTHGRAGYDFNTASAEDIVTMRRSYALRGTTTIMATLASAPLDSLYASVEAIGKNRQEIAGIANIAGCHLEGRYLNPARRGAHAPQLLKTPDGAELGELLDAMMPLPIHVSAALELADDDFYGAALSRGATLGLAHTDATYDDAMNALSRGATSFTHTYNAMPQMHHREPGAAAASLLSDAYSEIICDGEHVHPAMISMLARLKDADRLVLITDSMEAAGCPDGEYAIAGERVFVKDGRAVNVHGALAGSTLDLMTALANFVHFTGRTLEEAIPAATENPARMVGIDSECGRIMPGLQADIVILKSYNEITPDSVWAAGGQVR